MGQDMGPGTAEGTGLKRPRLLVETARISAARYRRERHLRGLLGGESAEDTAPLGVLRALEEAEETSRRAGAAGYRATRHVALLGALLGEMRRAAQEAPRAPGGQE
ncbi:DUF6477 family protein [Roseivivax sp. GX 12232]|uniref:DUF6477 family protein n=1 Tax=Roseivivax sp. GX 12232 TaxID=2900547 RepID=UPI001E3F4A53|nr:DUF6477 family protein [Roseivivax sp. GX 12232]MCE0504844.1 DUF6477 family protein [Roseivivax sp. GX 12232]